MLIRGSKNRHPLALNFVVGPAVGIEPSALSESRKDWKARVLGAILRRVQSVRLTREEGLLTRG